MAQAIITPWIFSEAMYQLEGKPFRFGAGRNYLRPIHNADMPNVLLMTGRQVEKSTTVSVKIGNNVLLRNFSRSLYVAPMNEQVKTFSRGRLDKLFRYSQKDLVRKRYMDSNLTNQVFHKEFKNGSEIYLRNCFEEADNIRGLSIDDIFIDEVQDIIVEALPVIMETQARSKKPHFFLTGTPKTFSNTIQQQWDRSSQADWVIVCPACRKHQVLGVPSVTATAFVCRNPRCRKPLPDIARAMGRWEHHKPEANLKGFRITQMMVPDIDVASVYNKIMTYPKNRLYNEVLGRSFEKADKPFSELLLNAITNGEKTQYARIAGISSEFANQLVFMGIDWGEGEKSGEQGTGYTVISIYAFNTAGKFQMLYGKRFERGDELDPDFQIKTILQLMEAFKINLCVADYGAGQKENMRLRKILGPRFVQCHYVGRQKLKIVYEPENFKYKIPRSPWLTDYVEFVQGHGIEWPGKDNPNLKWLYENYTSVYSEYRSSKNGISEELFYGHSVSEPDDAVHSGFYAWLASKIYQGGSKTSIPGRRSGSMFRGTYGA
jgi:ribosomal protein L22